MTLSIKYANGFESGLASGDDGGITTVANGITAAAARSGDYGLDLDAGDFWVLTSFGLDFTKAIHIGFAFQQRVALSAGAMLGIREEGGTNHLNLRMESGGALVVGKATSSTGVPSPAHSCGTVSGFNDWHYIEIAFLIHNSAGAIKVRLDGVEELNVSGIDTQNSGTAPTDGNGVTAFVLAPTINDRWFDDLVVAEASSTALEYLGEVVIIPGRPTSAVVSDMTGSDADQVDNHLLVDEHPPVTADYVESATVGHQDTYGTDLALAENTTVLGMVVKSFALKDDAGARDMGLYIKEGATEATSAGKAISTSATVISEIFETNPDTAAAWSRLEANAADIGVEIVS